MATAIAHARAYEEERRRAESLAELDRAKTTFFSNVSHEFRTPLTLMLGPVEDSLADRTYPLPTRQRERQEIVHRNALRLLKLVNSLLDFARIEAGRIRAVYQPTDLAAYTAEIASVFRSAVERAGLRLVVETAPLPGPVYVDREMWEKIVLNLLSNAFKFTFEGEIALHLRPADDDHVALSIRDTGTGIPAEELPHLFERFRRIEGAQGRTYEGTGIGLALVQELVRLHGGWVEVTSTVGAGSTFTITLPTGTAHLPPDHIGAPGDLEPAAVGTAYLVEALGWLPDDTLKGAPPAPPPESLRPADGVTDPGGFEDAAPEPAPSRPRILLADDNADMRGYVGRLLSRYYDVTAVSDGQAALACARQHPPDLVLSDVMMPGLDGFALLRALRADSATREVPVILLSARADEASRIEGLETGADDYLTKPFSARDLLARVGATIEITRGRKEAEARLRESEQRLRTLVDAAPLGIYLIDADFRVSHVNPVARPVFGDIPDLIGRDFEEVVHILWPKAYADEVVARFRHTLATGEPYFAPELIEERRDRGVVEIYESHINRILLPDGRFGVVCYFQDVSARVQARRAIAESETRFRALVMASSDVVYRMSPDWAEMRRLHGRAFIADTDEPSRDWLERYIHPDDQPRVLAAIREAIRTRRTFELEHRVRRVDGTFGWTFSRAIPLLDADGEIVEWFGAASDVTQRKQAEEALADVTDASDRQRRLYETILSTTPDLVYVFGLDYRFTYANEALLQMWGRTLDDSIGKRLREVGYEPWHAEMHEREIDQVVATKRPVRGEVPFHHAVLGRRIYDYILVPVLNAEGNVEAVAGTTRDVTERQQTEEALRLLTETLEQQVAARTAELERANAELRRSNRELQDFAYAASHDLQEPLRKITTFAGLLSSEYQPVLDETGHAYMKRMHDAASRMSDLLRDLLAFSRVATQGAVFEQIDLNDIVTDVLSILEVSIAETGSRVEVGPLPTVEADPTQMRQLFQNLIGNALKFHRPDASPVVRVRGALEPPEDGAPSVCRIEVTDDGIGFDEKYLDRIFAPFQRLHGRNTYAGTGMGLAICRRFVERHGGAITARSAPGQGARFIVTLPAGSG